MPPIQPCPHCQACRRGGGSCQHPEGTDAAFPLCCCSSRLDCPGDGMEGPQSISSVLLLFLLLPLGPTGHTAAQRCPQTCVCDNSRRHVACRHQNLTEVPNAIPELTQRLDLQGNLLKVLGPAAFQDLPYLTHLDLRHCQVELVAEGAFRGLGRLLFLNLASNRLRALPQEALDGLGSLRRLELEGNLLEELRPGTFGALGALVTLNLAHNALVYLPAMAFQGLLRARGLRLAHNALSVLAPEALAGLPALRRLSLHHNELQALPGAALSQARGLARLELGHNPFTYAGEEDGLALPGLRELVLDHGALQALDPRAFAHCPRLHTLDLRGNQLDTLPPLQGPGQLRRLRLQGNPLWCGCQARPLLEWLARARVRSDGACRGPRRLQGEALDALRPADLRCPGDPDEDPAEKEEPEAARPRAPPGPVSPGAFSGLGPRLQSLHLQKNQLQALPALPGLSQLELVDLSGNPFRCDCQLLPLHRWLTGLNLRVGATCAAPPSARGQRVKAAVAVFEACPSWASRKAKRMPSARRTRVKGRQRGADKLRRQNPPSGAFVPTAPLFKKKLKAKVPYDSSFPRSHREHLAIFVPGG
ncbi:chondroadherin-like protein [Myotis lucifugus]|uniref:chondroadherin-like protein n=1 Tax=Myotis lucifugus TaxID=59463 RepID=UPI000CCC3E90|nr:chondroadherin-like protein [Myotis lucifugus]